MRPGMDVRVRMREERPGRWVAEADTEPPSRVVGSSMERCLAALRRSLSGSGGERPLDLLVHVIHQVAGVAEAAQIMGWDKRRVITYIDRGRFPSPLQTLASGRVWLRSDVERFADEWRARQARRSRRD